MAISERVRQQFIQAHGVSLEAISISSQKSLLEVFGAARATEVKGASEGRGYVRFGEGVSATEKDRENLALLKRW